jgi:hypothetical protein
MPPITLSAIIMDLEKIAHDYENKLERREQIASRLEQDAELLFRLAGWVRHGKA